MASFLAHAVASIHLSSSKADSSIPSPLSCSWKKCRYNSCPSSCVSLMEFGWKELPDSIGFIQSPTTRPNTSEKDSSTAAALVKYNSEIYLSTDRQINRRTTYVEGC